MFGVGCQAIFGPLPYEAVVVIVEIMKIVITVNLGLLNASHFVQILIIFDFRKVSAYCSAWSDPSEIQLYYLIGTSLQNTVQ